ncbi:MAG: CvpA family protein [Candidatus Wallbacteria bacterium]|nr:CvpA family protein [Candidatus Wallbacteria bacterium]
MLQSISKIDILLLGLGAFLLIRGLFQGLVGELLSLLSLAAMIFLMPPLFRLSRPYAVHFPTMAHFILVFVLIFFLMTFLVKLLLRHNLKKSIGTLCNRAGGVLIALSKFFLVLAMLSVASEIELPPFSLLSGSGIVMRFKVTTSKFLDYPRLKDHFFDLVQNSALKMKDKVLKQPSGTAEVTTGSGRIETLEELQQELTNNAQIQSLTSDPHIRSLIQERNLPALMQEPEFIRLLNDPSWIEILGRLNLKALIDEAGSGQ